MSPSPAWQVREGQRQRVLEEIMRLAHDREEELDDLPHFMMTLAVVILRELHRRLEPTKPDAWQLELGAMDAKSFFGNVVMARLGVGVFSRSQEECRALLVLLLEKHVLPAALHSFSAALQRQEHENPRLIYRPDRAADEIEWPDEG